MAESENPTQMKKLVYLIDPCHETETHGLGSDLMPYQLGLLAAYSLKFLSSQIEFEIFKFVPDFEDSYRRRRPWLVAISNYFWNEHLGQQLLQIMRNIDPEVITVAGGPNYPDLEKEQYQFLKSRRDIDFYVYKDGEVPFFKLISALLQTENKDQVKAQCINSIHSLIDDQLYKGELEPRLRDLTTIPSPHILGLLDKFHDGRLLPAIQTNRGCPFQCTFCVEGMRYYTKVYKTNVERTIDEIDYIVSKVHPRVQMLRITDSNFGMFKEDVEISRYLGQVREKTGFPKFIYCSAGKNKQDRILLCNELTKGAMRLTASVQSFDEEVLTNIKRRNISTDVLMKLADKVADTLTYSYSETMLGIPGDSLRATEDTFDKLMNAGIGTIIQHQTVLLKGTEMASKDSVRKFGIKTGFRPPQRSFGAYRFMDEEICSMEIEEIITSTNSLSFEDYLRCRQLYFSVILFYNDRIFGEVHALLRILGLSTFKWIKLLNDNIKQLHPSLIEIYSGFRSASSDEVWSDPSQLISDFRDNIDRYLSGESGFNLSYKYKKRAILDNFVHLHNEAFTYLKQYLIDSGHYIEKLFREVQLYSYHSKIHILDPNYEWRGSFKYDIKRMIQDVDYTRNGGTIEGLRYPCELHFSHTPEQKEVIERLYEFYGKEEGGMTYLLARYPLKRLYRDIHVQRPKNVHYEIKSENTVQREEFVSAIT